MQRLVTEPGLQADSPHYTPATCGGALLGLFRGTFGAHHRCRANARSSASRARPLASETGGRKVRGGGNRHPNPGEARTPVNLGLLLDRGIPAEEP